MHRRIPVVAALAVPLLLAATGPATAASSQATVSVLHGVPGLTVDVFANGEELIPDFEPGTPTAKAPAEFVGAGAVVGWQAIEDDASAPIASAVLDPLTDPDVTGTAAVRETDGIRELTVDLDAEPGEDNYLEVWLLSPDASRLVSLGVLREASGTFPVPDGLDLVAFPVVDVSVEPIDGNPAHSGDSVVRGTLAQT